MLRVARSITNSRNVYLVVVCFAGVVWAVAVSVVPLQMVWCVLIPY